MKKKKIITTTILVLLSIIAMPIIIFSIIKISDDIAKLNEDKQGAMNNLYGNGKENNNDNNKKNNSNKSDNLIITNDKGIIDDYWYYVIGYLENHSNQNYKEVVIQFIALDANGYKLSTCSDIAYNLKSGESYPFKATCVTDKTKVNSYKLNTIIIGEIYE